MITKREFVKLSLFSSAFALAKGLKGTAWGEEKMKVAKVSLVKTDDRETGVKRAIQLLGINPVKGKRVILKPNFNSDDPFPGSTHNDTLVSLVRELMGMGAKGILVADRSGMGRTRQVMQRKGIYDLAKKESFELLALEDIPAAGWLEKRWKDSHWRRGVLF